MNATNFDDVKYIKCLYPALLPQVLEQKAVQFDVYPKIYADHRCPLTDDFQENTIEIFTFGPENLNFSDPISTDIINKEIADNSSNRNPNFFTSDILTKLTEVVLIDSSAFVGKWEKPFDPKDTTERSFKVSLLKRKRVSTMYQRGKFLYTNNISLQAKVLKMNYVGGKFSLAIVLPYFVKGVKNVQKKLQDPDMFVKVFDSLKPQEVDVYLPKFNITRSNRLKTAVEKAGVTSIFNKSTSGLDQVVTCKDPIVTEILQRTSIQVDELGIGNTNDFPESEQKKADVSLFPLRYEFKADRPFIFYLFYEKFIVYYGAFIQ